MVMKKLFKMFFIRLKTSRNTATYYYGGRGKR